MTIISREEAINRMRDGLPVESFTSSPGAWKPTEWSDFKSEYVFRIPPGVQPNGNRMNKDRKAVCDIISNMLDNPSVSGIFSTTQAYDRLERLVETARIEALGWAHADACATLDAGQDPRQIEVPDILERALAALGSKEPDK